jgi:hypothetical protein
MTESGYDHGAVGRFLATGVERVPAARTAARDLFMAYSAWMDANGLRRWTLTEQAFGRAVKDAGIEYRKTKTALYYLGLTPIPEDTGSQTTTPRSTT